MATSPQVSVIIPAYNMARYLPQAIDSALAQQGCEVEIIIVDDASTDDTLTVAQHYTDPRIRVLANETNQGPSYSRNRALDAAQGTWIAILDADDWFSPDRLARLLQVAKEEQADFVVDDLYMVQDGETVPFTTQFTSSRQPPQKRLIVDPVFFVRTNKPGFRSLRLGVTKPLMRNAFLKEHRIRYDEQVRFCEDMRLYLQCLLHGARFVVEPAPYYYRRKHRGSITAGNIVQLLEKEWQASPTLLNAPLIQEDEALVQAISQRTDELRRHLAFRRLQHALQSRAWRKAVPLLNRDALSFVVRRLFDRLRGAFFLRSKREPSSLPPRVART